MNKLAVYDIETLRSCFTFCFLDVDSQNKKQFVIHQDLNEFQELNIFLQKLKKTKYSLVGYNNVRFDSQILQFIMDNYIELNNLGIEELLGILYSESQKVIRYGNLEEWINLIPEWKLEIPQIDLYLINHYNNKNKKSGLKWLEFTMQMDTIQEMPIDHNKTDITLDEVVEILKYNWHDVRATYDFYLKNIEAINLRYTFREKYKLNCINWNDVKLGSELLLDLYCKKTNSEKKQVREMRTYRKKMLGKDIVFPYIEFISDDFNNLLKAFKNLEIHQTKNAFEFNVKYKGFQYDYGLGGIQHVSSF